MKNIKIIKIDFHVYQCILIINYREIYLDFKKWTPKTKIFYGVEKYKNIKNIKI